MVMALAGADAERALPFRSTLRQTNVHPSWRAFKIVATRAHESNDKKVAAEIIEQIVLRGAGAEDSESGTLTKFTVGVVGKTTRYR